MRETFRLLSLNSEYYLHSLCQVQSMQYAAAALIAGYKREIKFHPFFIGVTLALEVLMLTLKVKGT